MKQETLEMLVCPSCHGDLSLHVARPAKSIEEGELVCTRCEREFPIEEGIVRFIRREDLSGLNRRFARLYDVISHAYFKRDSVNSFTPLKP